MSNVFNMEQTDRITEAAAIRGAHIGAQDTDGAAPARGRCGRFFAGIPSRARQREENEKRRSALARAEREACRLAEQSDSGRILLLDVSCISPGQHQPRRVFDDDALLSLAESIRTHGILQPLTVRRADKGYELIAGERRLRAAAAVGMAAVPCIVLDADGRRAAELALIENLQRENLNLFEQAGAIAALIDLHAMTQEQIARSLSVSQSCVANKLRLLRLTEAERQLILTHRLTERHARAFLRIRALDARMDAVEHVCRQQLNVAATEAYVDAIVSGTTVCAHNRDAGCAPDENAGAVPVRTEVVHAGTKKLVLHDLRLFFNTCDTAVRALREAGIDAEYTREERGEEILCTTRIRMCGKSPV
ncbi:MAG: ParB/RepB/Spo0J family partition protein [Clostridia bacterium]|nr:ParB/RepB/Spo0J family partition protein [Clostridia bacterium]